MLWGKGRERREGTLSGYGSAKMAQDTSTTAQQKSPCSLPNTSRGRPCKDQAEVDVWQRLLSAGHRTETLSQTSLATVDSGTPSVRAYPLARTEARLDALS